MFWIGLILVLLVLVGRDRSAQALDLGSARVQEGRCGMTDTVPRPMAW